MPTFSHQLRGDEYHPYYQPYIDRVEGMELLESINQHHEKVVEFFKSIPDDKLEYRYAEGKWTVKEILQHLVDTERVMCYRAFRFSRKDRTPLSGFDQDAYVPESHANSRTLADLLAEYVSVRQATRHFFNSLNEIQLMEMGNADGNAVSVRALGFIIIGHETHHCAIIRKRYL